MQQGFFELSGWEKCKGVLDFFKLTGFWQSFCDNK